MNNKSSQQNEDDMWLRWLEMAPKIYHKIYYDTNPIVSYINNYGHTGVESKYSSADYFQRVLEVGAGNGQHLPYVRHTYDEYYLTDLHEGQLKVAQERHKLNQKVIFERQDALRLTYDDNHFDRLISVYNLEHLPSPHCALKEWRRVVKKGGVISIAVPAEGSMAWSVGRYLTTRRYFAREGLNLDYIIAREHVNPCYHIVSLIRYYFSKRSEVWFPFKIPTHFINLIYLCDIRNDKE